MALVAIKRHQGAMPPATDREAGEEGTMITARELINVAVGMACQAVTMAGTLAVIILACT